VETFKESIKALRAPICVLLGLGVVLLATGHTLMGTVELIIMAVIGIVLFLS
jgi:hypothetical protein